MSGGWTRDRQESQPSAVPPHRCGVVIDEAVTDSDATRRARTGNGVGRETLAWMPLNR